jgi:hypothetical protein
VAIVTDSGGNINSRPRAGNTLGETMLVVSFALVVAVTEGGIRHPQPEELHPLLEI